MYKGKIDYCVVRVKLMTMDAHKTWQHIQDFSRNCNRSNGASTVGGLRGLKIS